MVVLHLYFISFFEWLTDAENITIHVRNIINIRNILRLIILLVDFDLPFAFNEEF